LCNFLHCPVASFLLSLNIPLSTLFSSTLSLCSSLNVRHQVSHPYKTTGRIVGLLTSLFITSAIDYTNLAVQRISCKGAAATLSFEWKVTKLFFWYETSLVNMNAVFVVHTTTAWLPLEIYFSYFLRNNCREFGKHTQLPSKFVC
jgi:hypothetical protein